MQANAVNVDALITGIRVGYGAFPRGLIDYIWRVKQPYNVSAVAEIAALAALSNPAYLQVRFFLSVYMRFLRCFRMFEIKLLQKELAYSRFSPASRFWNPFHQNQISFFAGVVKFIKSITFLT